MDLQSPAAQEILEVLSRHCPNAISTYIQCINRADENGSFFFSKTLVQIDMSESWAKFRNAIKKLALEGLLEWHPVDNGIYVTLAVIDDE